ncbi:protein NAR1-like isoform X1 [Musa acuminata AAA Group]|uniref:protein NAR1-like isoform X1 n=1 Tax=Musa acuminata AAA Group TaxID=214697 RepID=UPI0031D3E7CB
MSEKFSPALRLADLNDFIAPSQDCIVSLKAIKSKHDKAENQEKVRSPSQPLQTEAVKISLKDCLACSGCITSAETIMLEKQSLDEFLAHINYGDTVVVSISPQSRTSLAAYFDLSPSQVLRKVTTLFKSLGAKAVYDTSCSRDLSLIESCNEFILRYQQHGQSFPMLSSACPGWICYAEKTLGSYILPYISHVKSPQQTIGAAIKHHIVQKFGLKLDNVYHVTVMPCYDKKLEAARDDFSFPIEEGENGRPNSVMRIPEVDSVLTTGEVLDLIQSKSIDFKALKEAPLDSMLTNVDKKGHLFGVSGGSGGYAETVFCHAAKKLFGKEIQRPIEFIHIRNSDFREVTLEVCFKLSLLLTCFNFMKAFICNILLCVILQVDGKTVLKFALCYGFRNLQNIVRKIKMGKCDYHFIEVMACPSGCLNGGGQIKPRTGQSTKDLIQQLEILYMQDVELADPFDNPVVQRLYDEWLGQPGSEKAKRFLHTEYHPLVKSTASQLHNW